MKLKRIGQANHIHDDKDISIIKIGRMEPSRDKPFMVLADGENSLIIHSIEQWNQIDAFVRKSFDDMEG